MKKIICSLLVLSLALCLVGSTALASNRGFFEFTVQCVNSSLSMNPSTDYAYKFTDNHKLYVYHNVVGGSTNYTNLFHAVEVHDSGTHVLVGQKWVTPLLNVPIQANTIIVDRNYTVSARGNTKHYELDNVSYITLKGNFSDNG